LSCRHCLHLATNHNWMVDATSRQWQYEGPIGKAQFYMEEERAAKSSRINW
jgi:hypothetical protein